MAGVEQNAIIESAPGALDLFEIQTKGLDPLNPVAAPTLFITILERRMRV